MRILSEFDMVTTTHKTGKKSSKKKKGVKKTAYGYNQSRAMAVQPKQELKAFDTQQFSMSFKTVAAGANMILLNAPIRGTDLQNRIARKIYMKSVQFRGFITSLGTTSLDVDYLRLILFYDANPNGGTPLITDLLQPSATGPVTSYVSHVNLDNRQRFSVLREWYWVMGNAAGANGGQGVATGQTTIQDGQQKLCFNEFIKLKGLETTFNIGGAGTIADINEGALFLCALCYGVGGSANWTMLLDSRLRFYD